MTMLPAPQALLPVDAAVDVRPIRPGDRDALTAFYAGLSPDSLEARFHGACRGIADGTAKAFCGPDHEHREGLVAEASDGKGRRWIVGHLCLEPSAPGEVEMAIAIADAWQRRGIGRALLVTGIAWARGHGLTRMRASMRFSNSAVIGLVRSLGMPLAFGAVDGGIVEVVIPIEVALPHAA
jgi:GNAT superfamily N-acetyltransferase